MLVKNAFQSLTTWITSGYNCLHHHIIFLFSNKNNNNNDSDGRSQQRSLYYGDDNCYDLFSPVLIATTMLLATSILFVFIALLWRTIQKTKRLLLAAKIISGSHIHPDAKDSQSDVIVVGSGILGSAMATVLARDGRRVTLIERDWKEPDRIIGELLQPGGCDALHRLGLQDSLLECEEAQAMNGYVIHDLKSNTAVHIPYPKQADNPTLCKQGRAFRHGKFINALRETAEKEANVNVVEGFVSQLIVDENDTVTGVQYKIKGNDNLQEKLAPLVVVADGTFSKFRKQLHDDKVQVYSHFVGCIMKNCPQIRENHAELVLANPNLILIYKISEDETRVLVDIRGQTLPKNLREYLLENILPAMPEHLSGPFEDGIINERIRYMPCKFLPPSSVRKDGVLMLGDAFNLRHPITGGGMSVAFSDIAIWRELLRDIPDLRNYASLRQAYKTFQNRRKSAHSFVVNILAQALYELFSANDEHLGRLRNACFEYFKIGGVCVEGPIGLLSVVSPKPFTLIGHFFAVALFSVWLTMKKQGFAVHRGIYQSIGLFHKACQVIFPLIWTEIRTIA